MGGALVQRAVLAMMKRGSEVGGARTRATGYSPSLWLLCLWPQVKMSMLADAGGGVRFDAPHGTLAAALPSRVPRVTPPRLDGGARLDGAVRSNPAERGRSVSVSSAPPPAVRAAGPGVGVGVGDGGMHCRIGGGGGGGRASDGPAGEASWTPAQAATLPAAGAGEWSAGSVTHAPAADAAATTAPARGAAPPARAAGGGEAGGGEAFDFYAQLPLRGGGSS